MSRIHEALKKAEEQRVASQGGRPIEPVQPADLAVAESLAAAAAPPEGTTAPVGASIPSFGSPYTLDTLLARCPQGRWSPDRKTMLFFNPEEQEYGNEEFRTLRSRLYQIREKQSLKKVLVTSALPKEGKSFVAANLAQVMVRQEGRRALLIDSDLRGSRLHEALGTSSSPGLSDYLLGEKDEFAVMQRGSMENLFFIPSGRSIGNPAELTVLEFAREIIRATGSRSKIAFKPLPQDDPKQRRPDITKARKILRWEPKVKLSEGLDKTIAYFRRKV